MFDVFGHVSAPAGAEGISESRALMSRGDHVAAVGRLEQVLAHHPYHTVALTTLAGCHSSRGDHVKALELYTRAVEIEPNLAFYRGGQVSIALSCPRRYMASKLFNDLQARHPHLRDFDYYGIHAYLLVGEPGKARELFERAALRKREADELRPVVEAAVQAHERYMTLEGQRYAFLQVPSGQSTHAAPTDEEMLRVLEETHASYPANPFIEANLGVMLSKAGEHQRAASLLISAAGGLPDGLVPYCWANAAYCLIALSQWGPAMMLLKTTMGVLKKGPSGHVEPCDVPGIVNWIFKAGTVVVESLNPAEAELLDRAVVDCPDPSLIGPEIREMAALLRKFRLQASHPGDGRT
jgi:tetratricopeptide (TPR) repeat protein